MTETETTFQRGDVCSYDREKFGSMGVMDIDPAWARRRYFVDKVWATSPLRLVQQDVQIDEPGWWIALCVGTDGLPYFLPVHDSWLQLVDRTDIP